MAIIQPVVGVGVGAGWGWVGVTGIQEILTDMTAEISCLAAVHVSSAFHSAQFGSFRRLVPEQGINSV